MTDKQRRFAQEYLVDLNATRAAERAGYKDPRIGPKLKNRPPIAAEIQRSMERRQARTEITQDRVVTELARVAFANGTDYARVVDGGRAVELTDTDGLTDSQRAAVASIETTRYGVKIGMYNKLRALELLGRHLGMFEKSGAPRAVPENNLLQALGALEEIDTDDLPEVE